LLSNKSEGQHRERSSKGCHKTVFDSQLIKRAEEKLQLGQKIKYV